MDYKNYFNVIVNYYGYQRIQISKGNQFLDLLGNLFITKLLSSDKLDELYSILSIMNIDTSGNIDKFCIDNLEKVDLSENWMNWAFVESENFLIIDLAENYGLVNILEEKGQYIKSRITNDSTFWYDKNGVRVTDFDSNNSLIISKSFSYFINGNQSNINYFIINNKQLFDFLFSWRDFISKYENCQITFS